MRFKLDENLPVRAVEVLRAAGHDAVNLLDHVAAGAEDAAVALLVQREGRVLVTLDLDFADIRAYEPGKYRGIVVRRPRRASADDVVALVTRLSAPPKHRGGAREVTRRRRSRSRGPSRLRAGPRSF